MSFEIAAIVVLFLLVPAYPIQLGLKRNSRFQLKASALKEPMKTVELLTISSVLFSTLILPIYLCIGELLWNWLLEQDFVSLFADDVSLLFYTREGQYAFRIGFWGYTTVFYILSLVLAYAIGRVYIFLIESGALKTTIHHGMMYNLIKGTHAPVVSCSLLTKIQSDAGYMMYRGRLQDIAYLSENKIDYVVLKEVKRFTLPKDTVISRTEDFDRKFFYPVSYFKERSSASPTEVMYFDGQEVSNILFSRVDFESK